MTSTPQAREIRAETVDLTVADGTEMPVYVARPVGGETYPGLMVFQEAFGVNEHIRDVTRRFAGQGFVAAAPALFHRTDASFEGSYTDFSTAMPHMSALTTEGLSADIQATYQWLTGESGVESENIGCVGYCLGGRCSFLANTLVPLKAAASYYGGGIAPSERSAGLLERAPHSHAPILLFWGDLDTHIGPEQQKAIADALTQADKEFSQIVFSKADHGFFCDARSAYNPAAAAQAWAMTNAFFDFYLRK